MMVLLACIGVWPALDSDLVLPTLVLLVTLWHIGRRVLLQSCLHTILPRWLPYPDLFTPYHLTPSADTSAITSLWSSTLKILTVHATTPFCHLQIVETFHVKIRIVCLCEDPRFRTLPPMYLAVVLIASRSNPPMCSTTEYLYHFIPRLGRGI
jgi:hypothetical protein